MSSIYLHPINKNSVLVPVLFAILLLVLNFNVDDKTFRKLPKTTSTLLVWMSSITVFEMGFEWQKNKREK